jgi:hypothetical protein
MGLRGARQGWAGLGRARRSLKFTKIHKKSQFWLRISQFLLSVSVFAENDSVLC